MNSNTKSKSKAISLKLDDELFEKLEEETKRLKVSRNRYLNEAVSEYHKKLKRELIIKQIEYEAPRIRASSMEFIELFDTMDDGNQYL